MQSLTPGEGTRAPSYLPGRTYAATVFDLLREALGIAKGQPLDLAALRVHLTDPVSPIPKPLRDSLITGLSRGASTLDALRIDLERQFDAAMERAAGWYKRHTQFILLVIALVIAGCFNLDSFYIAQRLLRDPQLRASAVDLGHYINPGDHNWSADQFVANLRMQANLTTVRIEAVKSLKPAASAPTTAGNLAALRDLHNDNHYNRSQADIDWQILTATDATQESVLSAANAMENCPSPPNYPARPSASADRCDWLNYVQSLTDTNAQKDALAAFFKSRNQWCLPDRNITTELCALIADAVRSPADATPLTALQTFLTKYQIDAEAVNARLDAVRARLPKVGWIGDVWPYVGITSLFGWLTTALMASFGAPLWFDLIGRLVNLRSVGVKPAASQPLANR